MKSIQGFELKEVVGLALIFLVVTIILSFGGTIIQNLKEDVKEGNSVTWVNKTSTTATWSNGTTQYLETYSPECTISSLAVTNATEGQLATSDKYLTSGCYFTWYGNAEANELNFSYTASWTEGAAFNTTVKGEKSITTFADWLPTLALIVIAAVIIGVIVRYFAFGQEG